MSLGGRFGVGGFFCSLSLGLGFFVSLLEQDTTVSHLVDRINIAIIATVV